MSDKKNNTGTDNTGDGNSGDWNSGYGNSGYGNSGDWNSGYGNSGDWNSGDGNSGNRNSGYGNSGYWNSGDWNSGDCNSGYGNSGNRNSGYGNSGDGNSGYGNSGDGNSGYGNLTNRSAGIFCSEQPKVICFNKPTDKSWDEIDHPHFRQFYLTKWISDSEMTDQEKVENPKFHVTGGCLRKYSWEEAWANFWRDTDEDNRARLQALPNFDATIFKSITGIDLAAPAQPATLRSRVEKILASSEFGCQQKSVEKLVNELVAAIEQE